MLWTMPVIAACTAGVGFYVRFLLAMCKECKLVSAGYWRLLRVHSGKAPVVIAQPRRERVSRAA
ncbi:MAG TPA: hypothetical protein VMP68_26430 [Candidatus Eisenbacteria bacterium]|nr:hypothetical protein [Candidatus Eisenbacteria bacterium]